MSLVESAARLALGTVQFGLPYGVANQQGQVTVDEVALILQAARQAGVSTLDTAIAYGESERVIGQFDLSEFAVITKLSKLPSNCGDVSGWVEAELAGSLQRLNLSKVDALLMHRPLQLLDPLGEQLYLALQRVREQGLTRRIGVSVYAPQELTELSNRFYFDLVQAPFNILDQRLQQAGWLQRLAQQGTALHVRSIFMQGLLLMSAAERPAKFARWSAQWRLWHQWLLATEQTALQACLRHALGVAGIERVVVGVDSLSQWQQILQAAEGHCPAVPADLGTSDVALLNPALWSNL